MTATYDKAFVLLQAMAEGRRAIKKDVARARGS